MSEPKLNDFFGKPIAAINVGLAGMAEGLQQQNVPVTQVDWKPPLGDASRLFVTKKGQLDVTNDYDCGSEHRLSPFE